MDRVMNVPSPAWASFFPKSREPLSSGLRAAYTTHDRLPAEFRKLLDRLGSTRRAAQRLG